MAWWQIALHLLEPVADVEDRARPRAASRFSVTNRSSASCGVSTEVGSSMMISSRLLQQAADDLDALPLADRKVGDDASRD